MAAEEEVSSKKKVLKKEYGTTAATKPGMPQEGTCQESFHVKGQNLHSGNYGFHT